MQRKNTLYHLLLTSTFLLLSNYSAQSQNNLFDINFEFQAYPTGLIPSIRFDKSFTDKNAIHLRLGYNWVRHRDLGKHEDERGNGVGFTLGFRRYIKDGFQGLFIGVRSDIWFNKLDWADNIDQANERTGITKITVLQPTTEGGFLFQNGNFILAPTIGFGLEINVKTEGEPVGEGLILLLGINVGYRFGQNR